MKPLVSIIVATYRRDTVLLNALCSLSNQSYSNIEVVLVDDNDDAEWNKKIEIIAEKFRTEYPSIMFQYIVNHPNQGSAKTRNIGIMAAKGEYITFLDDDDVYLAEKVEKQVSFMEEKKLDYSITDLYLYNENNKLIDKRIRNYIIETSEQKLFEYHMKYHITGTDTMMFRKDYIIKIGGFPPINVGDEFYLMQRSIENGGKFGYLPQCDVKAYVHTGEGGLSSGQGKLDGENALYDHKKIYFGKLNTKTVKYIKARHYVVLAYAHLRMGSVWKCLGSLVLGFFVSPFSFFKVLYGR